MSGMGIHARPTALQGLGEHQKRTQGLLGIVVEHLVFPGRARIVARHPFQPVEVNIRRPDLLLQMIEFPLAESQLRFYLA
jgi:hypothetical protein